MKLHRDQTVKKAAQSTRRRCVASESITAVVIVLLLLLICFNPHFIRVTLSGHTSFIHLSKAIFKGIISSYVGLYSSCENVHSLSCVVILPIQEEEEADKAETEEKTVDAKHIIEYVWHLKTNRENLFSTR